MNLSSALPQICSDVQKHQQDNNGGTDLAWLKEHTKVCQTCQRITGAISGLIEESFSQADD